VWARASRPFPAATPSTGEGGAYPGLPGRGREGSASRTDFRERQGQDPAAAFDEERGGGDALIGWESRPTICPSDETARPRPRRPEAKALLTDAVKKMSVQDAKGILTGGEDSATQYFKRTTSEPLRKGSSRSSRKRWAKVKLAEKYNEIAASGASSPGEGRRRAPGRLRHGAGPSTACSSPSPKREEDPPDPAAAGSAILRKVFGALRN